MKPSQAARLSQAIEVLRAAAYWAGRVHGSAEHYLRAMRVHDAAAERVRRLLAELTQ